MKKFLKFASQGVPPDPLSFFLKICKITTMEQNLKEFVLNLAKSGIMLKKVPTIIESPTELTPHCEGFVGKKLVFLFNNIWTSRAHELLQQIGFLPQPDPNLSWRFRENQLSSKVDKIISEAEDTILENFKEIEKIVPSLNEKNWVVDEISREFHFTPDELDYNYSFFIQGTFKGYKALLHFRTEPNYMFCIHTDIFSVSFSNLDTLVSADDLIKCMLLVTNLSEVTPENLITLNNPPLKFLLDEFSVSFMENKNYEIVNKILRTFVTLPSIPEIWSEDALERLGITRYKRYKIESNKPVYWSINGGEIKDLSKLKNLFYVLKDDYADEKIPTVKFIDAQNLELSYYTPLHNWGEVINVQVKYLLKPSFFSELRDHIFNRVYKFTLK